MQVLIIGSDTPLGLALENYLGQRERQFISLPQDNCHWKSERQAKKALRRAACDFVVDARLQAASDGGVRIHDIDIDRCGWLAASCQSLKTPYFLMSSSAVYRGDASLPYAETAEPDNTHTLGTLLMRAEQLVGEKCEPSVILRMGPLFTHYGVNVITHMMDQLHHGGHLIVGRHRRGCPVPAEDAARVVSAMLDQYSCGLDNWGVYHYCSSDVTDCYEFAEVLLAAASQYEEFPQDAAILAGNKDNAEVPVNLELDCSKIRDTFAVKQLPWRASVARYIKQYYALREEELPNGEGHRHRDTGA